MEAADRLIKTEKEKQNTTYLEDLKKDWPICPDCNKRPMAPWNKTGRCSYCQQYKKKKKNISKK